MPTNDNVTRPTLTISPRVCLLAMTINCLTFGTNTNLSPCEGVILCISVHLVVFIVL